MSTAFSQRMQGVATRLLNNFGSTASLLRAGSKTWNPVTAEYEFSEDTELPLTCVPVPVNASLIDGTAIQAGDVVIKADSAVEPKLEDKVNFSGAVWSIVAIETKQVNDDIIAWFIQVRK